MNAMPKPKLISTIGGIFCLAIAQVGMAEAPDIVGQITSNGNVQVTSEGLTFTVEKGQPYLVFAGDVITTADAAQDQTATKLIMDSVGTVSIAPGSAIAVDRIGSRYQIDVKQGKMNYSLQDSADVRITTKQGELMPSGQSGSLAEGAIASLGDDVMVFGQEGSVPVVFNKVDSGESLRILGGDELIYSSPAKDSKVPLYAQLGAPDQEDEECQDDSGNTAAKNDDGTCPAGFFLSSSAGMMGVGSGIGSVMGGAGAAAWLGVVGVSVLAAATDDDDDGPASPVR